MLTRRITRLSSVFKRTIHQEQSVFDLESAIVYATQSPKTNWDDEIYDKWLNRSTYSDTLKPITSAHTLPPEVYTDDHFFHLEQEKVFKKTWFALGHFKEKLSKPGDILSTNIGQIPVLLVNDSGTIKGFYNVCRHRGSLLLKEGEYKNTKTIRCPYHCWTYLPSGQLHKVPYFNDDKMPLNKSQKKENKSNVTNCSKSFNKIDFNKEDYSLFSFGVREFLGTIFVNLDTDMQRRDDLWEYQMGDLYTNYGYYPYDDMSVISENVYDIQANYKLIAENFTEYYHLPWVHPELCELSSVANHIGRQGVGQYSAFGTCPLSYGSVGDPDSFPRFNGINDIDAESGWFIQLFPNISLWFFPNHFVSLITYPHSPGVTKETMTVLMNKSIKKELDNKNNKELEEQIKTLTDFYIMVNNQDIEAVEGVQKGLEGCSSVYRYGRFSGKFEESVYRYQHILIDYMTNQYLKKYPGDDDFVLSKDIHRSMP